MKTKSMRTRLACAVCVALIWTAWVCPKATDAVGKGSVPTIDNALGFCRAGICGADDRQRSGVSCERPHWYICDMSQGVTD